MSKQIAKTREIRLWELPQEVINRGREMADRGHDIWLAGLGAVATVEEEGSSLFTTLVERGQKVEAAGRKRVDTVRGEISARQKDITSTVEETVYEPLLTAMKRFGVPTRGELRDLASRVDTLTKKVEMLVTALAPEPQPETVGTVYYVMSRDDGWIVGKEGRERAIAVHNTKEEALERARALANDDKPSRLDVYKKDGAIQDTFTYEA